MNAIDEIEQAIANIAIHTNCQNLPSPNDMEVLIRHARQSAYNFHLACESQVKAKAMDWVEENSTYSGGGDGGIYSFKVTHDSESMIDAIQKTAKQHLALKQNPKS